MEHLNKRDTEQKVPSHHIVTASPLRHHYINTLVFTTYSTMRDMSFIQLIIEVALYDCYYEQSSCYYYTVLEN